ncbi:MAG: sugar kinase, partial [Bacteroidota bacterium]
MSLLAVGTLAFDDIETPYGRADMIVGGSCTYIALAASYYTRPVQIVSVIGDDFPEEEMNYLRKRGADLGGVETKEGQKSFFWAGRYHDDMIGRDTLD